MRTAHFAALAWLAVVAHATAAHADPMPMTAGAQPVPAANSQIALELEDLRMDVGYHQVEVRARFRFRNGGPARTLRVGFPCAPELEGPMSTLYCKAPLKVRVEGRPVKVRRLQPAERGHEWHFVWSMHFAAEQRVELDLRYTAPLVNERYGGLPLSGMALLHYRLATGARWAGPIRQLEIEVRLPLETLVHAWPAGYERSPGRLKWRLKDVEPDHDLAIFTYPMANGAFLSALRAKSAAAAHRALEGGTYNGKRMLAVAARMQGGLGRLPEQVAFFARISAKGRQLRMPPGDEVLACARESIQVLQKLAARAGVKPAGAPQPEPVRGPKVPEPVGPADEPGPEEGAAHGSGAQP